MISIYIDTHTHTHTHTHFDRYVYVDTLSELLDKPFIFRVGLGSQYFDTIVKHIMFG